MHIDTYNCYSKVKFKLQEINAPKIETWQRVKRKLIFSKEMNNNNENWNIWEINNFKIENFGMKIMLNLKDKNLWN